MLKPERIEEVAKELETYNTDITGLKEIRWPGEGMINNGKYAL